MKNRVKPLLPASPPSVHPKSKGPQSEKAKVEAGFLLYPVTRNTGEVKNRNLAKYTCMIFTPLSASPPQGFPNPQLCPLEVPGMCLSSPLARLSVPTCRAPPWPASPAQSLPTYGSDLSSNVIAWEHLPRLLGPGSCQGHLHEPLPVAFSTVWTHIFVWLFD